MPDPELPDPQLPATESAAEPPAEEPAVELAEIVGVSIEVPLTSEIPSLAGSPYVGRRVEVGHLTAEQATALWRLRKGLSDNHARLASGRHVDHTADAVRWLLERIGEGGGRGFGD